MGKHTTYKLGDDWDGKHDIVLPTLLKIRFIWGWVKTLVPSEPQFIAGKWMFIPLKMYL